MQQRMRLFTQTSSYICCFGVTFELLIKFCIQCEPDTNIESFSLNLQCTMFIQLARKKLLRR